MSILELLDNYPKAAIVVKQWFLDRMLESLNNDSLPEEFKDYVKSKFAVSYGSLLEEDAVLEEESDT